MAKRKQSVKYDQRKIAQGDGSGRGKTYKPWLRVRDVPSQGLASRVQGWKTERMHTFLSGLELKYFYLLEWNEQVSDIREQFPLLPQDRTLAIAERLGVRHPQAPGAAKPLVMTTDFLVTAGGRDFARSVKPARELEDPRVIEKLAIEQAYWEERNVDWKIVTEDELPQTLVENIKRLHPKFLACNLAPLNQHDLRAIEEHLKQRVLESQTPLRNLTTLCDEDLGLASGSALSCVWHFLATRHWRTDMATPIEPTKIVKISV
jgi:hypothetical protein